MKNKFYINEFHNYIKSNNIFTNIFVSASFILIVSIILFFNYFIYAFFNFNPNDYKIGEPAKQNYTLKSDFSYYNDFETELARKVEEKLVLPVYKIDNDKTASIVSDFLVLKKMVLPLLDSKKNKDLLIDSFNNIMPNQFTSLDIINLYNIEYEQLFTLTLQELKRLLNRGYIASDSDNNNSNSGLISVISYSGDNSVTETVSALSVLQSRDIGISPDTILLQYINKMVSYFIKVNCFYDREQTKHNKELSLSRVEPVVDFYRKGEILIKKDFVVTNEVYNKIKQAEAYVKKDTISKVMLVIGYIFLLFVAAVILFTNKFIQRDLAERDVVLITGITLFYTIYSVLLKYFLTDSYFIFFPLLLPTVLISMIITFLLGNRVGLYLSVILSFLILLVSDFSIYVFTITLVMSILSTIIVHDVEKRINLIKASGELSLLQSFLILYLIGTGMIQSHELVLVLIVSISSSLISGILTLALLPVFEHLLKISTCFQLSELCDLNAPLLKSMLIKAPGTYAHSIQVANMAESAAQHIGANALLAKAGGYYHDIGKIDQPLYFIENQKGGKNLHDEMKPSLSVAVIKSHVKLGIDKAKNIGLPREVINIIEQHHGKGSISYFLEKARKENKGTAVLTEDFAYGGPNPENPEAAIVMLADSVEAAVRSLKNPTISQLEKFVWELILNKLKDGMLDTCGLTLSDLTTIKDSFINTLMGYYHSRIEYPTNGDEK